MLKHLISNTEDRERKISSTKIERKFLMKSFPDDRLILMDTVIINQAYLSVEPEVRIKSETHKNRPSNFTQTIKSGGTLTRTVIKIAIKYKQFEAILKLIDKATIQRDYRVYILEDGSKLKVSHVDNAWFYGEIKFKNELKAKKWNPTDIMKEYIIKEVTFDSYYKMKNYWERTRLGRAVDKIDILGVLEENEFKAYQERLESENDDKEVFKYVDSIDIKKQFENITEDEIKELIELTE